MTRGQALALGGGGTLAAGLGAYWWMARRRAATASNGTTTSTTAAQTSSTTSTTTTTGSTGITITGSSPVGTSSASSGASSTSSGASSTATATSNTPPTLQVGSTGNAVKTLQADLNTLTAWGLAVDGSFGPLTLQAVRAFQAARGITVDGIVGPVTWSNIASTLTAQKNDPYVGGPSPGVSGRLQWPLLWQQAPATAPSYVTRRCGYAWVTYKNPTGQAQWVAEYLNAQKVRVYLSRGTAGAGTWAGGYVCPSTGTDTSATPTAYASLPSFVTRRCGTVYVSLGAWPNRPGYVRWQKFTNGVSVSVYPQPGSQARGTWVGGYVCPTASTGTGTSSTSGAGATSGGGAGGLPPIKE